MNVEHEDILERHMRGGIDCWVEDGFCWPKVFVAGADLSIVASPHDAPADPAETVALLAEMAQAAKARFVGTTDEVWTKSSNETIPGVEVMEQFGKLAEQADRDPLIRTGIATHAIDLRDDTVGLALAIQSIDDHGEMTWEFSVTEQVAGSKVVHLIAVADCIAVDRETRRKPATTRDVLRLAEQLGWTVRRMKL